MARLSLAYAEKNRLYIIIFLKIYCYLSVSNGNGILKNVDLSAVLVCA